MEEIIINYSKLKSSEVRINGYKHGAVMVLMASLISRTKVFLKNVPDIEDVQVLVKVIERLNGIVSFKANKLYLDTRHLVYTDIPESLTASIHGSIYLISVLSCVFREAKIGRTGGCQIGEKTPHNGNRPVEHILEVLQCFGANYSINEGGFSVQFMELPKACVIDIMRFSDYEDRLSGPLVSGATKAAILTAMCVKDGVTIIKNPYQKGDVRELTAFIEKLGYPVQNEGSTLIIYPQKHCYEEVEYEIMSDPSEIFTYVTCAIYNKISLNLTNITMDRILWDLRFDIEKLTEMGINLIWQKDVIIVPLVSQIRSVDVEIISTGILSDHQPFYCLLLLLGDRKSSIVEHVWYKRFNYAEELVKLGAKLTIDGNSLKIEPGLPHISGQVLVGLDLRGVAALIIAALVIRGTTKILGIEHIKRGYQSFFDNLKSLGCDIQ